ncbi:hypothetical protein GLYMA_19G099300v4 [Glycine max]|uniref:Serine-threonine/tyrosine-protein kinase catalytic domain-containing protein n=1 Tax=Glycine max TaxID=3847 RepID=A0A0R0ETT1_SOYBN|nr:hypothetical protein JHK85_053883 [Glycine max]KAH1077142.1 hypothetical protein GYH30_052587 [Glycine max]KRG94642.1 hypothetical protein GLYMA_19G099300v4 [Glycine max]
MRSDIYVFGIVLLELITGHRACDDTHGPEKHLDDWAFPMFRDRRNFHDWQIHSCKVTTRDLV